MHEIRGISQEFKLNWYNFPYFIYSYVGGFYTLQRGYKLQDVIANDDNERRILLVLVNRDVDNYN